MSLLGVFKKLPILVYWQDMCKIKAFEMHVFVNAHVLTFTTEENDTFVNQQLNDTELKYEGNMFFRILE